MEKKVPILLIAWKRPFEVKQVINSIRLYKPNDMYIFCDGYKNFIHDDNKKIRETREIIDKEINWRCNIEKNYCESNIGCKKAVSSAITWFFTNVEEGIILEDDCVPNLNFYLFCENLLERYRNKKEIFIISGNNFQDGSYRGNGSYYYSIYTHIWGWATWKDRWDLYDINMTNFLDFINTNKFKYFFKNSKEQKHWKTIFSKLFYKNRPNTWDYQLFFAGLVNNKLNILPNTSLVENIGFSKDSTHIFSDEELVKTKIKENELKYVMRLKQPSNLERDFIADTYTFFNHYRKSIIKRLILKLRRKFII